MERIRIAMIAVGLALVVMLVWVQWKQLALDRQKAEFDCEVRASHELNATSQNAIGMCEQRFQTTIPQ